MVDLRIAGLAGVCVFVHSLSSRAGNEALISACIQIIARLTYRTDSLIRAIHFTSVTIGINYATGFTGQSGVVSESVVSHTLVASNCSAGHRTVFALRDGRVTGLALSCSWVNVLGIRTESETQLV